MAIPRHRITYGILTCLVSTWILGGPLTALAAAGDAGPAAAVSESVSSGPTLDDESVIIMIEAGDTTTVVEGMENPITLPITQTFRTNRTDTNAVVQYRLTPVAETQDTGYTVDTAAAVSGGLVSFQAGGAGLNEESFAITGDATGGIAFSSTTLGMYVFDLSVTSEDDAVNGYRYDHGTYHLRYYVRDGGEVFFTAQNEDGDKVSALSYEHTRWIEDGSGGGDGGSNSGTESGTTIQTSALEESGNLTNGVMNDVANELTEDGSILTQMIERGSAGPLTGDASHMMLYAAVMLMGIAGLVIWRKFRY